MALCKYGVLLLENGEDDAYIRRIWDIVTFDLEWVLENWDTEVRGEPAKSRLIYKKIEGNGPIDQRCKGQFGMIH